MSSFEMNKVFAAVLVAGITAMFAGFIADKIVHPHMLETDAVAIEGGPVAGGGARVEKKAEPILHLIATADVARGEKLSKACAACHSFDNGGPNKVGPNLWNVMGGPMAHLGNYEYSSALANFDGVWGYVEMNQFLWKPKKYIPGTKMNYNGIKKPADRAAMIAWLRTLSPSPEPMPNAREIADELALLAPPIEDAAEAVEGAIEDVIKEAAE